MKVETVKFDKVINASEQNGKINHEPDSSKEQSINAPKKTSGMESVLIVITAHPSASAFDLASRWAARVACALAWTAGEAKPFFTFALPPCAPQTAAIG